MVRQKNGHRTCAHARALGHTNEKLPRRFTYAENQHTMHDANVGRAAYSCHYVPGEPVPISGRDSAARTRDYSIVAQMHACQHVDTNDDVLTYAKAYAQKKPSSQVRLA